MQHPLLVKPDPHPVVLIRNKVKRHLDHKGELLMASVLINVSYSFDPVPSTSPLAPVQGTSGSSWERG